MSAEEHDKLQRALEELRNRLGLRAKPSEKPWISAPTPERPTALSKGPEAPGEPVDPALARKAETAMQRLRALRGGAPSPDAPVENPVYGELLEMARRRVAGNDMNGAADVLDALLSMLPPLHPQRGEVVQLLARARGAKPAKKGVHSIRVADLERKGFKEVKVIRAAEIGELISKAVESALGKTTGDVQEHKRIVTEARAELDRRLAAMQETVDAGDVEGEPDGERVVDPALSAGYLLMSAQDGELTPEEIASLEDRLGAADPVLRVEWAWLERTRAALGRVATFVPAEDDVAWDRLRAGVRARLEVPAPTTHSELPRHAQTEARLKADQDQLEHAHRNLEAKLDQVNRQFAAEKQAFLREKQEFRKALVVDSGPRLVRCGSIEAASVHVAGAGEPNGDVVEVVGRDGGVDVLIADASGRGVAAVVAASMTHASVLTALATGAEPTAALAATNRTLKRTLPLGTFVAASLVRWDEARGRAVIAGAGGEDVLVYRASERRVERFKPGGIVLGVVAEAPAFAPREVELAPGDALVLVSDGVTEALGADGEPFCDPSWKTLTTIVAAQGHLDATALVGAVRGAVQAWTGQPGARVPDDDLVVVVLRRTPAPARPEDAKIATVVSMLGLDAFFKKF